MTIHNDIEKILFTEEEIQEKVKVLALELEKEYKDKNPLLVCVLKGGSIFMTDLIRQMSIPLEIDFMDVSSYGDGFESTGEVKILKDLSVSVKDRHVIFIEDIIDTGRTLQALMAIFETRHAASVEAVTLLDKPARRAVDMKVKWAGFEIPDEFILGYGLDYKNGYRHLPYIGVLKAEVYEND